MLPLSEKKITLAQATRLAPGRPHPSTLWRWARRGVRARNGEQVHLEHGRFGRTIFTTAEALNRFADRLTRADSKHFEAEQGRPAVTNPTRRDRQRAIRQAQADCAAADI